MLMEVHRSAAAVAESVTLHCVSRQSPNVLRLLLNNISVKLKMKIDKSRARKRLIVMSPIPKLKGLSGILCHRPLRTAAETVQKA